MNEKKEEEMKKNIIEAIFNEVFIYSLEREIKEKIIEEIEKSEKNKKCGHYTTQTYHEGICAGLLMALAMIADRTKHNKE